MGAFGAALALQTLRPCTYLPGRGQAPSFPRSGYAQGGLRPRSGTSRICAPVLFLLADQDNTQHQGGGQCVERFSAWSVWRVGTRYAGRSACLAFASIALTRLPPGMRLARSTVPRAWSCPSMGAFAMASHVHGRQTATKGYKRPCLPAWLATLWRPLKTMRGFARAFPTSQEPEKSLSFCICCLRLPGYWQGACTYWAGYNVREAVRPRRSRIGRGAL